MFHFSTTRPYNILLPGICLLLWHTASTQARVISAFSPAPGVSVTLMVTNSNTTPDNNIVYLAEALAKANNSQLS